MFMLNWCDGYSISDFFGGEWREVRSEKLWLLVSKCLGDKENQNQLSAFNKKWKEKENHFSDSEEMPKWDHASPNCTCSTCM